MLVWVVFFFFFAVVLGGWMDELLYYRYVGRWLLGCCLLVFFCLFVD